MLERDTHRPQGEEGDGCPTCRGRFEDGLWEKVFRVSQDGLMILTDEGVIVAANPKANKMLESTSEGLQGRNLVDLAGPRARDLLETRRGIPVGMHSDAIELSVSTCKGNSIVSELTLTGFLLDERRHYIATLRDIARQKARENELRMQSHLDELTGLYNRRGFLVRARRKMEECRQGKGALFFVFFDVDGLKRVNDLHGHAVGDEVLRGAGQVLRHCFRQVDVVGRLGGDEFAVVTDVGSLASEAQISERLIQALAEFNSQGPKRFVLSISWGVSSCEAGSPLDLNALQKAADRQLYEHKKLKRHLRGL